MPVPSKANGNVPSRPGRIFVSAVSNRQAAWVRHEMGSGAALTGVAPRTAAKTADELDPEVTAGKTLWGNLTEGGLFTLIGDYKRPLICEAIDNPSSAALTLVTRDGTLIRNVPTAPFTIAPGEYLKASGGGNGGKIGFLLRIDEKTIL